MRNINLRVTIGYGFIMGTFINACIILVLANI